MKCGRCGHIMNRAEAKMFENPEDIFSGKSGDKIFVYYCLGCGNSVETQLEDKDSIWVPWQKYVNFINGYPNANGSTEYEKCSNMRRKMIDSLAEAVMCVEEDDMKNILRGIGGVQAPRKIKEIIETIIKSGLDDSTKVEEKKLNCQNNEIGKEKGAKIFFKDTCEDQKFEKLLTTVQTKYNPGYYGDYYLYMEATTTDGRTFRVKGCEVLPLGKIFKFKDLTKYIKPDSFRCAYRKRINNNAEIAYLSWEWIDDKKEIGIKLLDPVRLEYKTRKLLSEIHCKKEGRFITLITPSALVSKNNVGGPALLDE